MINSNISDYTNALNSIQNSKETIGRVDVYFSEEIAASKFLNQFLQKIDKILSKSPGTKSFQISYPNLRALEMLDMLYGNEITYQTIENSKQIIVYLSRDFTEIEPFEENIPSFWNSLLQRLKRPQVQEDESTVQESKENSSVIPSHLKESVPAFLRRRHRKTETPAEEIEVPSESSQSSDNFLP